MRRLLLLLLVAACDGGGYQQAEISATIRSVRVVAPAGRVSIATHEVPNARLDARTKKSVPLREFVVFKVEDGELFVSPNVEAELEITVPQGLPLKIVATAADVAVEGAWSEVDVRTATGAIRVDAVRIAGGTIWSAKGDVSVAIESGPPETLACSSLMGDVSVELARTYRGRIYLNTKTGKLDAKDQPNLRLTWSADNRTVLAFAGAAFTDKERAEELKRHDSPQAVRATSASGTVRFRLREASGG